jgi:hypothetical protein
MSSPFVTVETHRGNAVLKVSTGDNSCQRYPLNYEGCRQAGRDLHDAGVEDWMCSSSVDFPQEVKAGFRGDVRELMTEGWQQAYDKKQAPRKSLIAKMLTHCSGREFQYTLTPDEQKEFQKIKDEYKHK